MPFRELIPILQTAIGPVIVISGVGLLLLSMTNRFGRVIDSSRRLAEAARKAPQERRGLILSQLQILSRRGRLLRLSITLATCSVLLAALLIITLFLAALLRLELALVMAGLFILCMGSLIVSLLLFIRDINLSLSALELEIKSREEVQGSKFKVQGSKLANPEP